MPMIGLTPWVLALDQNSKAPKTLPWSVIAIESMPSSAVRENRSSSRAAPSSMEYSVWTCRWTKSPEPLLPAAPVLLVVLAPLALLGTGLSAPLLDARRPTGRDRARPGHAGGRGLSLGDDDASDPP